MRTIHAARAGTPGDHRTDGIACRCDPHVLADMNEPGIRVLVHRPIPEPAAADRSEAYAPRSAPPALASVHGGGQLPVNSEPPKGAIE